MPQMKIVSSCGPIPFVIDGVDQSQFGREYMFIAPSHNHNKKGRHRTVEVSERKIIVILNSEGLEQKVPAVAVHVNGRKLLYPAMAFSTV